MLMATERRDLLPLGPPWPSLEGIQPLPNRIVAWPPAFARLAFKGRFNQLVWSGGSVQLRQAAEAEAS